MNPSMLKDGERINNNISSFIIFPLFFVLKIDRYSAYCLCLSYGSYHLYVSIFSTRSFKSARCLSLSITLKLLKVRR